MYGVTKLALAPVLVLFFFVAGACGSPAPIRPTAEAQQADTLTATVRQVNEGRGFEVITGVQLALKLYYVYVDEDTRVVMDERPATVDDLQPGQVVRIRYRRSGERMVAEAIELVEVPGRGGER